MYDVLPQNLHSEPYKHPKLTLKRTTPSDLTCKQSIYETMSCTNKHIDSKMKNVKQKIDPLGGKKPLNSSSTNKVAIDRPIYTNTKKMQFTPNDQKKSSI